MSHMAIVYRPTWPLGRFVQTIWYYEGYTQPHAFERLMPDGMMSLVINLEADCVRVYDPFDQTKSYRLPGTVILGAHQQFFVIDTAERKNVLGVQFLAGGAFPFLTMPADELQGRHVSLDDIWGAEGRRFRERLLDIPTPRERCRLLEQELLARAANRLEIRSEVRYAVKSLEDASCTVTHLIESTGLSARRFTELFRSTVGLTPKTYSMVRRFQSAMRAIEADRDPDWTDIALSCGYFDQAHFIHDFSAFSGLNPSKYVMIDKRNRNHVPIG